MDTGTTPSPTTPGRTTQPARYRGVVVGSSLGGVEALQVVFGSLRTAVPVPVVVAHHLGPSASLLEKVLGRATSLPVRWAVDGAPVTPGTVHLCPARAAVRWEPDDTFTVRHHEGRSSLGSVDELFTSAATTLGPDLLALVLTGSGTDGTAGAGAVRDAGGTVVVQDAQTAVALGMPGSVAAAGLADLTLPLPEIPELLDRVLGRGEPLPLPGVLAAEAVFAAGGEVGALLAATDWARSALGPVERWPPLLASTLGTALASEIATAVLWGRDLVLLYNDRCGDLVGNRHPAALGRPLLAGLPETEHLVGPLLRHVWDSGRGLLQQDRPFPFRRRDVVEEAFFTVGAGPLRDGTEVVGVLATVVETTGHVQGARRLRLLHRLAGVATGDGEAAVGERAVAVLSHDPQDVPFALLYVPDRLGTELHLCAAAGLDPGTVAAPRRLSVHDVGGWPVSAVLRRGEARTVDDLGVRFRGLSCGPHAEQPSAALVLPAGRRRDGGAAAVVVLGVNARIPLDPTYRSFLDLVAEQVGASLTAARRHREARGAVAALAAADRDRTEFLAGVGRELRAPLTRTLDALDRVLRTDAPPDAVHAAARRAHGDGLRLLTLVDTLLEFARLEQGRGAPRTEDVDVAALTEDVAGVFRAPVERAGLGLVVDCPPLGRTVPVDPEMWERIVLALVSNALKHTFAGTITVTVALRHHHVELEVTDTGVGIAGDELPHLFARFHRIRGARARSHDGPGLGLALVQQLARRHHGSVRVRSTPGEGSRFTVWLPLVQRGAAGPPEDGGDRDATRAAHRRAYVEEAERWLTGP